MLNIQLEISEDLVKLLLQILREKIRELLKEATPFPSKYITLYDMLSKASRLASSDHNET